jgi:hypothetical protein
MWFFYRNHKMTHFIPLRHDGAKAKELAHIFIKEIWRLHGLPVSVISDRDSRFTSDFWRSLIELLGVKARLSTAFHPQTDGQTERMNQILEAYIRAFCDTNQQNWPELLPYAEFAYNNSVSSATGLSPFYANYGQHPNSLWGLEEIKGDRPTASHFVEWIRSVHDTCKQALKDTRERMGRYHDKNRQDAPPFKLNDLVLLDLRNIKTTRPAKKFDNKYQGPFKIIKVLSRTAYRLELPKRWKIHNVFHVSLLEPYHTPSLPNREAPNTQQVLEEAGEVVPEGEYSDDFAPLAIRDIVRMGKKTLYLVEWENEPKPEDWTLEPLDHVKGCPGLVWDYWKENQEKPVHERFKEFGRKEEPGFFK